MLLLTHTSTEAASVWGTLGSCLPSWSSFSPKRGDSSCFSSFISGCSCESSSRSLRWCNFSATTSFWSTIRSSVCRCDHSWWSWLWSSTVATSSHMCGVSPAVRSPISSSATSCGSMNHSWLSFSCNSTATSSSWRHNIASVPITEIAKGCTVSGICTHISSLVSLNWDPVSSNLESGGFSLASPSLLNCSSTIDLFTICTVTVCWTIGCSSVSLSSIIRPFSPSLSLSAVQDSEASCCQSARGSEASFPQSRGDSWWNFSSKLSVGFAGRVSSTVGESTSVCLTFCCNLGWIGNSWVLFSSCSSNIGGLISPMGSDGSFVGGW